uniref:5'-nucleotidase domain-containing protein 4 n=1 Tax=Tanacetum cinerariifolium TaxID=118510 RepID=A0A6L2JRD9_TANCI|nr:5'-nucleotidase domain-containing protein 4 [Tanacetum cinerariifolium]
MKIHGGRFIDLPRRNYVDGEVEFVDLIDIDQCTIDILDTIMYQSLAYEEKMFYHYKIPLKCLDIGLRSLASDTDIDEMLKYVIDIRLFMCMLSMIRLLMRDIMMRLRMVVKVKTMRLIMGMKLRMVRPRIGVKVKMMRLRMGGQSEEKDEAEDGGQSKEKDEANDEDKDVEDIVDKENIVDKVEVQMNGFKFEVEGEYVDPMQPKLNMTETDLEMLDFDSFESDVEDAKESARRKGLRKLRKQASNSKCKPNTIVKINVYGKENLDSPTRIFRRIYIFLGALKDGFRAFEREMLGLDGAFMKG